LLRARRRGLASPDDGDALALTLQVHQDGRSKRLLQDCNASENKARSM